MFYAVQLMSIEKIGAHGYPFSENVIPKIKALRQKFPGVKIEVDGGINMENAKKLSDAGADVLVVGSAIFSSENVEKIIKELGKN
jgi:ribulose-phosphate 3-epimerase